MFQRWLRFYMYIYAGGIDVFKRLRDNNYFDFFDFWFLIFFFNFGVENDDQETKRDF